MVAFVKPDLNEASEKLLVDLVMRGRIELGEIPQSNREPVARKVEELRVAVAEAKAKAEAAAPEPEAPVKKTRSKRAKKVKEQ